MVCSVLHLLLLFALDLILLTGVIIKTFLGTMFSIVLKTNIACTLLVSLSYIGHNCNKVSYAWCI